MRRFALPAPISTNALFTNVPGKGRVVSKAYAAWKREAAQLLMAQRARPIEPPYRVSLTIPAEWRGDLDNAAKAPLDALQAAGVIRDDRLVSALAIARHAGGKGISAIVEHAGTEIEHRGVIS